ncbi:MAG TPA: HU family DNA-binding protein [Candidatus Mailhella merdavium]|nr:HU family DNA-binding protein [Candidatus Mailhella merdavium]
MTKAELVAQIATKADLNKASAERTLNVILDSIGEILAEKEKLTLTGFGSFVVEKREARIGRNPRTGSQIEIPAAKVVKFRVGKTLKNAVQ